MRRLILLATVATLTMAKPGTYREKEDFQFSRSSTDEGSKSGFYGAQRGNMGGNYERAHNMDGLAQHQMSGLVRQVEGELGEGSKTRTGSVFTAANSRGIYGSGHYDLSNLGGRNFQEGVTYGDSHQQSSMTAESGYNAHSSAANSAAYSSSHSQSSRLQNGYNGYQYLGHNGVQSNLQQAENLQTANQYGYGGQAASGYYSQSAYDSQNSYDHTRSNSQIANSYGSNGHRKVFTAIPVKVVLRPGATVAVPIATQTYDSAHIAAYDQNSISSSNSINQNAEAELLTNQNQYNGYRPVGAKHYESSYSYRKEWEKHDTKPVTDVPFVVPATEAIPKNSELYEDAQSLTAGQQYESTGVGSQSSQHSHSRNYYGGYNTNVKSASSSQSLQDSAYNNQHYGSASSSDNAASSQGSYNSGVGVDSTNQIENVNSKPKSYHSSYSYHKSWERQGDPYVIKPASSGYDAQASQRLTAASSNQGTWTSRHYGSQQSHQNVLNLEDCDCDEYGHARVARSYNSNQFEEQDSYQPDQQFLSQQSQNLEDLSQKTQSQWDKLVETGQQTQNQWDKLEDVGQQSQAQWGKLEDLGQQTENKFDKIEDLGQQTQNKFDKIEDLGQQVQNPFDKIEDLGQQAQNSFDKIEDLGQHAQNQFDKIEDLGQQTQSQWNQFEDAGQQTQSKWDNFDGQHTQLDGQQLQNTWNQMESGNLAGVGQETQTNWDNLNIQQQDKSTESFAPKSEAAGLSEQNNINKPENPPENIPGVLRNPWNQNTQWDQLSYSNNPAPAYNNLNHPWLNYPQSNEQLPNKYYNQQTYNSRSNHESSFFDSQSQNNWHYSYLNTHPTAIMPQNTAQGSSTLWNLWNKVDTIEKQTTSSKNDTSTVPDNNFNYPYPWLETGITEASSTTSTTKREETSTVSPTTKDDKRVLDGKSQPSNIGRGDIGPEDIIPEVNTEINENKPKFDEFVRTVEHKPYKTPAEIEALSQVIDNGKTNSNVNHVIRTENDTKMEQNENKENSISQSSANVINNQNYIQSTQSTEGMYRNTGSYNENITTIEIGRNNNDNRSHGQQPLNEFDQGIENLEQQNMRTQFETFDQLGVFPYAQNTNISRKDVSTESVGTTIQETQYLQGTNSYISPVILGTNLIRPRANNETETKLEPTQSVFLINESVVKNLDNMTAPGQVDKYFEPSNNGKSPSSNNNIYNDHWFNHMSHPPPNNEEIQTSNFYNQKPDTDNTQQYENFGDQNNMFYQQNSQQELESFQQQNNFDQQNTDQQFDNFDLQNGKENMNMEQQFETFTQQITTPTTNDTLPSFDITVQKPDHIYYAESINNNQKSPSDQQSELKYENFSPEAPEQKIIYTGNERNTYNSYNKLEHNTERFDKKNWNQVEDLTQQIQTSWQPYANEKEDAQETQNLEVIPVHKPEFETILQQERAPKSQTTLNMDSTTLSTTTVGTLPEAQTEKPGFWKSVGNKFVSAKDKVVSWFSTG